MDDDALERWRQGQGEAKGAGGSPWWRTAHDRRGWLAVLGGVGVAGLVGLGAMGGPRLLQPAGGPPVVSLALPAGASAAPTDSSVTAATPPPTAPEQTSLEPEPAATEAAARPVVPASRPDCAAATGLLSADVDGDGCTEELRYAKGVLSTAEGMRWEVGQDGDQVAIGDWWCDGDRTLALLRLSSGQAFVFGGWADPGTDLEAMAVGRAVGASAVRAADLDGDGCGELVVERGTLPPAVMPVPARHER